MARTSSVQQPTSAGHKPSAKKPYVRRRGAAVEPDYILRLLDAVGAPTTADLIGSTTATVFKARQHNVVSPALEIASRGVWNDPEFQASLAALQGARGDGAEATAAPIVKTPAPRVPAPRSTDMNHVVAAPTAKDVVLFLIQVPADRAAMLQRAAEMMGAVIVTHD